MKEIGTLTYTGNNVTNVRIRRGLTTKNGSEVVTASTASYTYDDKVNPFYDV